MKIDNNYNFKLVKNKAQSESEIDLAKSIRINPKQFTLKPGKTQTVRYVLRTPPQLPTDEYKAAFVFSNKEPVQGNIKGKTMNINYQIVATSYLATDDITRNAKFKSLKYNKQDNKLQIQGRLNSTGNGNFRAKGYYKLYNKNGKEIKTKKFDKKFVVLPSNNRNFNFNIKTEHLKPGEYKLKVIWEHIPAGYLSHNNFEEYKGQTATVKTKVIQIK